MRFERSHGIKDQTLEEPLRQLLIAADKSFVPPLSSRKSSTDQTFLANGVETDENASIESYLDSIRDQEFIFAISAKGYLAGFATYRMGYRSTGTGMKPCVYLSTVIVDERFRGQRLLYDFYGELFSIAREHNMPLATRTWSTNDPHIHVLDELGFEQTRRIANDRGRGIDTVYYVKEFDARELSLWERIKAYKLTNALLVAILLGILTVISAVLYFIVPDRDGFSGQLWLAFSTSLLVSAICLIVDVITGYRASKNDEYLTDMKTFGIQRLNFDKQTLLAREFETARGTILLSGYRHILTSSLTWRLADCRERGVRFKMLTCPPWLEGYKQLYEDSPKVIVNYIKIFRAIIDEASQGANCEIRFTSQVMFSDTYQVDDKFITSPYCRGGDENSPITAREFFTLVVESDTRLYELTKGECDLLWKTADQELDCAAFLEEFPDDMFTQFTDEERRAKLAKCLRQRNV